MLLVAQLPLHESHRFLDGVDSQQAVVDFQQVPRVEIVAEVPQVEVVQAGVDYQQLVDMIEVLQVKVVLVGVDYQQQQQPEEMFYSQEPSVWGSGVGG